MKKLFTLFVATVLALCSLFSLTACGNNEDPTPTPPQEPTEITYSASTSKDAALSALNNQTADIAVIDSLYANYYINKTGNGENLTILTGADFEFLKEEIVIATKKDSDIDEYLNAAMYYFQENEITIKDYSNQGENIVCDIEYIAKDLGVSQLLLAITEPTTKIDTPTATNSEWKKAISNGLTVGYTYEGKTETTNNFPTMFMSHLDGKNGFELLLTRALGNIYGKEPNDSNCKWISWDNRVSAIENGEVDLLIGGCSKETFGENDFDFTNAYLSNAQVIVIRKADAEKYKDFASMKSAKFTALSSSKAETVLKGSINTAIFG